jgi:hypothetical protein
MILRTAAKSESQHRQRRIYYSGKLHKYLYLPVCEYDMDCNSSLYIEAVHESRRLLFAKMYIDRISALCRYLYQKILAGAVACLQFDECFFS